MPPLLAAPANVLTQGTVLDDVPWGLESPPLGIVLSNACDLEHEHATFVLLGALEPAREVLQSSKEFKNRVAGAQDFVLRADPWKSLVDWLQSAYVYNARITRFFFLESSFLGLDPLLVDFQHLISLPLQEARSKPLRAALPSPDREKLVVHFAAYTSRVGVERIEDERARSLAQMLAAPYRGPDTKV